MVFTFSITSSKIDVLSGTGTLATLYTEAIADTAGCMTSPSANVYQVEGNRELELSSGVTVTTADGDTLQWNLTANKYPILDVAAGATLNLTQNTTIIGDTNSSHHSYIYLGGTVNCNGTSGNEVIWENYRSIYVYMYDTTAWNWDYVILRDNTLSSGYYFYCVQTITTGWDGHTTAHSFTNITVTDTSGWGYIYIQNGDYSSWTLDNWTIDGLDRTYVGSSVMGVLSNFTITNTDVDNLGNVPCKITPYSNFAPNNPGEFYQKEPNQPIAIFDSPTFDDCDSGYYGYVAYCGNIMLMKNPTIENQSVGFRAWDGIIMIYGTPTYTNVTTNVVTQGAGGAILHVRKLNLTVEDTGSSAIENATVRVRTKLSKTINGRDRPYESWVFFTDQNGEVNNVSDGDGIYLTEREETSAGNFTQWSDGTGNNVHVIEVFKDGYEPYSQEVAMNQDRTINVTLSAESTTTPTTIYDSTIYDSNIY